MKILGVELQRAGIGFVEATAVHRNGRMHVVTFVAASGEDLERFVLWSAQNDVDFDDARIATPEELAASKEWS